MKKRILFILTAVAAAVTACGGGGEDGTLAPVAAAQVRDRGAASADDLEPIDIMAPIAPAAPDAFGPRW
jgi:hypothetical protein